MKTNDVETLTSANLNRHRYYFVEKLTTTTTVKPPQKATKVNGIFKPILYTLTSIKSSNQSITTRGDDQQPKYEYK